ncbi:hypothetical protein GGF50DRAFT_29792, partial [Schizophyllum commune]
LVRQVIRDCLGIVRIKDAWMRPTCSTQRLAAFRSNPTAEGPKSAEAPLLLDTSATTLKAMKNSPWNEAIIHVLVLEVSQLAGQHAALSQWEYLHMIDWESQLRRLVYVILGDYHRARSLSSLESPESIHARMEAHYSRHLSQRVGRRIREWKYDVHCAVAASMVQAGRVLLEADSDAVVSRARDQLPWWEEACRALELLTQNGMSDEEDGFDEDEPIRLVRDIKYRNPQVGRFLETLDQARVSETAIFQAVGRSRRRRVKVPLLIEREPPPGLPMSFFRPGYLQEIGSNAAFRLRVDYEANDWRILNQ